MFLVTAKPKIIFGKFGQRFTPLKRGFFFPREDAGHVTQTKTYLCVCDTFVVTKCASYCFSSYLSNISALS